ncbi:MAG: DUF3780 domain-containing protein, partial [Acetobacteraceae bacterium]|nr:DUF3780 domain-containing protein [Acetobacteraceae bacterium]
MRKKLGSGSTRLLEGSQAISIRRRTEPKARSLEESVNRVLKQRPRSLEAQPVETGARPSKQASTPNVVGFGCPAVDWPHHLRVLIPSGRAGEIQFIEDFGIQGSDPARPDEILRCALPRPRWNLIADPVRREFNERLKVLGLPPGRWVSGENKIERMLGQEL